MDALLTPDEFAARAIGVPWARWRSDWRGMDCFGCVALYFREVLGVSIDVERGRQGAHGFDEWDAWITQWSECEAASGDVCFMAWRNGVPTHCGIVMRDGMVLHAQESDQSPPGSVRATRLSTIERVYARVTYYRYTPC